MSDIGMWIGGAAMVASTSSFIPQAVKVIKSRKTTDISAVMYTLTVSGFALWLSYGIVLGQWPIIATNGICLIFAAFILVMKLLPPRKKEKVAEALTPSVD